MQFTLTPPGSEALKEYRKILSPSSIKKGLSVAINQSMRAGKKEAANIVSQYYYIPKAYLNKLDNETSTAGTLEGSLWGDTTPIPLGVFDRSVSKRGGVTVKIRRSKSSHLKFAFVIPGMPKHVFARGSYRGKRPYGFISTFKKRKQPDASMTRLVTLSLYGALNHRNVRSDMNKFLNQQLLKNIDIVLNERAKRVNNIKSK